MFLKTIIRFISINVNNTIIRNVQKQKYQKLIFIIIFFEIEAYFCLYSKQYLI